MSARTGQVVIVSGVLGGAALGLAAFGVVGAVLGAVLGTVLACGLCGVLDPW